MTHYKKILKDKLRILATLKYAISLAQNQASFFQDVILGTH